jgi:hypothetical protein
VLVCYFFIACIETALSVFCFIVTRTETLVQCTIHNVLMCQFYLRWNSQHFGRLGLVIECTSDGWWRLLNDFTNINPSWLLGSVCFNITILLNIRLVIFNGEKFLVWLGLEPRTNDNTTHFPFCSYFRDLHLILHLHRSLNWSCSPFKS